MPVTAFTFGAFGDLITLISLANTVRNSLSDARGSVADCQGLLTYLDGFSQSLEIVKARIQPCDVPGSQETSFPSTVSLSPFEAQQVLGHIAKCYTILEKFNTTLVPYVEMVDQRPVRSLSKKIRRFWCKIRWVTVRSQAVDVERRLAGLTNCIMLVLQTASL